MILSKGSNQDLDNESQENSEGLLEVFFFLSYCDKHITNTEHLVKLEFICAALLCLHNESVITCGRTVTKESYIHLCECCDYVLLV